MKKCKFSVVPRNGQAMLSMHDIDVLDIIKLNIHTIGADQTRGSDNCCAKMHNMQRDDPKQEAVKAEKYCTNTDSISKSANKSKPMVKSGLSETEYFLSGLSYESDKKRNTEVNSNFTKILKMYLMALGALMAHFHCSQSHTLSHTRHPQDAWYTHSKNPSRNN